MRWLLLWIWITLFCVIVPSAQAFERHQLLREVLSLVEKEHVDSGHLSAVTLFEGALKGVSEAFPEVSYGLSYRNSRMEIRVRAMEQVLSQGGAPLKTWVDLSRMLVQVHGFLLDSLPSSLAEGTITVPLINGLLSTTDSWSRLLSPAEYTHFQRSIAGRYGGVGLTLSRRRGYLTVREVLPGSTAAKAGIKPGDHILRIGFHSVGNMRAGKAETLLWGEPGTPVTMHTERSDGSHSRTLNLLRREIHAPSVESHRFLVREGTWVGYLRIREFRHTTGSELTSHLTRLYAENTGFLGMIIDLRGNPGGIVEEAISATDKFLNRGVIAGILRNRGRKEQLRARGFGPLINAPLVVLTDSGSASSAELMAAALKNNRRAVLIGEPTAGKGSVQSIIPVTGGMALRLSTARFLGPGWENIPKSGVKPDLVLVPTGVSKGQQAFGFYAPEIVSREASQQRLPVLQFFASQSTDASVGMRVLSLQAGKRERQLEREFPVAFAKKVLIANSKRGYQTLIRTTLETMRVARIQEEQQIKNTLAGFGKRWSFSPSEVDGRVVIQKITLEVKPRGEKAWRVLQGALHPGGQLRITVFAKNVGKTEVPGVFGLMNSESPIFAGLEFPIGALAVGETGDWQTVIEIPSDLPSGQEHLSLTLMDGKKVTQHRASLLVGMSPEPSPDLRAVVTIHKPETGKTGNTFQVYILNKGQTDVPEGLVGLEAVDAQGNSILAAQTKMPRLAARKNVRLRLQLPETEEAAGNVNLKLIHAERGNSWLFESFDLSSPGALSSIRELQSPKIDVTFQNRSLVQTSTKISGGVRDDQSPEIVLMYINGEKVLHRVQTWRSPTLDFAANIHLREGRNLLEIQAWDNQRISTTQRYVLWRGNRLEVAGASGLQRTW